MVTLNFSIINGNESELFSEPYPVITDATRRWLESAMTYVIFLLSSLGIGTNVINIRVFIRQGLSSDSNTIGLFALAIADFMGCFFLFFTIVCEIFKHTGGLGDVVSCSYMASIFFRVPHVAMSRISSWITVYLAVERCLCVLLPFKVKLFMNPRVATIAMSLIYVVFISVYIPLYLSLVVQRTYSPRFNSTVITVVETPMAKRITKYLTLVLNTITTNMALVIVAIATCLMIYKLNKYKKWRESTVASSGIRNSTKGDNVDSKHQRQRNVEVLKLVLMVTTLFLVCLALGSFPGLAAAILPGFSFSGVNANAFVVFYQVKFILDLINSSLNFFFYIRISSRYKIAFKEVFGS